MSICGYPHGEPNETMLYETRCGGCSHVRSANYVRADVVEREREADREAIRALHTVVETIRMQVGAGYLAPLACLDDIEKHAATIQRAQDAKG